MKSLKSRSSLSKRLTLQAFLNFEHDESTFAAVGEALKDTDPEIRVAAVRVLLTLGDVDELGRCHEKGWNPRGPRTSMALPNLVDLMVNDREARVRDVALRGLLACGPKAINAAIKILDDKEMSTTSENRGNAISILAFTARPEDHAAEDTLRRCLYDRDPSVRERVIRSLVYRGRPPETDKVLLSFVSEFVKLLQDPDTKIANCMEDVFAGLGGAGSGGVPHFLKALEDPKRRRNAVVTLSFIGGGNPKVVPALVGCLKGDLDLSLARDIAESLGRCTQGKDARLVSSVLQELLKDSRFAGRIDQRMLRVSGHSRTRAASTPPPPRK